MRRVIPCALALAMLASGALAQSLGDVAAQEKVRREREKEKEKKAKAGGKVYTDNDLLEGGPALKTTTPAPAPPVEETPSAPSPPSESEPSQPATPEAARLAKAQAELDAARQELAPLEAEIERLRQDLNPMSTTYNTEDVNLLLRLQHQLHETLVKAEPLRARAAEAQTAWEEAELAARRAGVLTR